MEQTGAELLAWTKQNIIALIALGQPWAYWAWRRLVRRGTIGIFDTGTIEVGYSDYGPTLGLQGTLVSRDRELFVRAISLQIIREADNAQHGFDWAAFRSTEILAARPTERSFQLPAGFLLQPSQPFRYNIFFNDAGFQQEHVRPTLDALAPRCGMEGRRGSDSHTPLIHWSVLAPRLVWVRVGHRSLTRFTRLAPRAHSPRSEPRTTATSGRSHRRTR